MGDILSRRATRRGLATPAVIARPARLRLDKQVWPSAGHARMNCGCCDGFAFGVHVAPDPGGGSARLVEVVCDRCLTVRRLDDSGRLDGDHKPEPLGGAG